MPDYHNPPATPRHDVTDGPIGILLSNLGTPEAPTAAALRPYLKEFLSDPRVIEYPRWLWWLILNGIVLRTRPRKSAKLYASIWTSEGSPLLVITKQQTAAVEAALAKRLDAPFHVAMGMRYGNPSIASGLRELESKGCTRILALPLYPQYFAGTTGSSFDAVAEEFLTWRRIPELRTVHDYHDDDAYIDAVVASIRDAWAEQGEPEKLVFSYHGIPERYSDAGDPYFFQCHETTRRVVARLGLDEGRYEVTFQSRFGREEWVKPYTDMTLQAMAKAGVKRVHVVCPGFSADCLETLEEIAEQNRGFFMDAGGDEYHYIPCLNDRADHVDAIVGLVERHLSGWVDSASGDGAEVKAAEAHVAAVKAREWRAGAGYDE